MRQKLRGHVCRDPRVIGGRHIQSRLGLDGSRELGAGQVTGPLRSQNNESRSSQPLLTYGSQ